MWSPDGRQIAFFTGRTDGTGLKQLTDDPVWEEAPSWSPDGRRIAYSEVDIHTADTSDVWVMNADGSGKKNLTKGREKRQNRPNRQIPTRLVHVKTSPYKHEQSTVPVPNACAHAPTRVHRHHARRLRHLTEPARTTLRSQPRSARSDL